MKVVVCPSDQTGCGKYRLIWPTEALKAQGKDVLIRRRPRIMVDETHNPPKLLDVLVEDGAEVIVIQRPGSYQIAEMIPILQKKGVKVVIDMDDDLSAIHPKNPAHAFYDPTQRPTKNWEWCRKACLAADLVTATTEALLSKFAPHGRAALLPNCVPERFLTVAKKHNEQCTVGWAGFTGTHPSDLQITHGAVNEALTKTGARFLAIGDKQILPNLGIRNRAPHEHQNGVGFNDYPEAISQFDIGIVPLEASEFNESKSWLKALEYAALGIAPVVSPTPDNMKMVNAGAAYLASSPRVWKESLMALIQNESERKDLVTRAQRFAAQWTIERNAGRWWEAWCTI